MATAPSLATVTDMIDRYDEIVMKDLCSDSGTPVTTLQGERKMAIAIESGSGRVLAACRVGKLYDSADIAQLEGPDASLCKDLVCQIAMCRLMRRRQRPDQSETLAQMEADSENYLKLLRDGHRVFELTKTLGASTPDVRGPTIAQIEDLNLITSRFSRYFPSPSRRLPLSRQY